MYVFINTEHDILFHRTFAIYRRKHDDTGNKSRFKVKILKKL